MSSRLSALAAALAVSVVLAPRPAAGADQVYFSKNTNESVILVSYINRETDRLDISSWYLSEHAITQAIAGRFAAGVPVRIIGDRGAIFEADPHSKAEFYWLANRRSTSTPALRVRRHAAELRDLWPTTRRSSRNRRGEPEGRRSTRRSLRLPS